MSFDSIVLYIHDSVNQIVIDRTVRLVSTTKEARDVDLPTLAHQRGLNDSLLVRGSYYFNLVAVRDVV